MSVSVPLDYALRSIAQSWSVPPWVVAGEEATPETVARWVRRELVYRRLEGD